MPDITQELQDLVRYIEGRDFAGYDPYDGLNSPLVRALSFGTKYGRIAWTQLFRRCPLNLRPLMLVKRGHNPKAIGLFLQGFVRLERMAAGDDHRTHIDRLIDLLSDLRSPGTSGNGWGYNFDWQSRVAFVPKGTPTIVNSAFVGHALLDAWDAAGIERARDLALPVADFILNDLHRKEEKEGFCFSYTPVDHNYVHNANLLGASLLIRIHRITGDPELRRAALKSLAYSMHHQRTDGSWFYAEAPIQHWVDSFHTGFNLEAIRYFLQYGEAGHFRDAYQRGVAFYAQNFFLSDGTPKYYHDRVYPIDIHAPCQAVSFFAAEGEAHRELTERILVWMLRELRNPRTGAFYFRRGRHITNRIPYMRWSQAWAFNALTSYLLHGGERDAT